MKKPKRRNTLMKRKFRGGDDRPGSTPYPNEGRPPLPQPPSSGVPALAPEANKSWWSSFIPNWFKKKTEPTSGGRTKRRRATRRGNTMRNAFLV